MQRKYLERNQGDVLEEEQYLLDGEMTPKETMPLSELMSGIDFSNSSSNKRIMNKHTLLAEIIREYI